MVEKKERKIEKEQFVTGLDGNKDGLLCFCNNGGGAVAVPSP